MAEGFAWQGAWHVVGAQAGSRHRLTFLQSFHGGWVSLSGKMAIPTYEKMLRPILSLAADAPKRDVALKLLPELFATDPERLARFQREAEVLATKSSYER